MTTERPAMPDDLFRLSSEPESKGEPFRCHLCSGPAQVVVLSPSDPKPPNVFARVYCSCPKGKLGPIWITKQIYDRQMSIQ